MNISQESDYALRAISAMYSYGKENRIEAKYIAEKENIPIRFLFKILRKLCEKGIVKSYRGVNGGYKLNVELKDITLKDIVEVIQGPIRINKCTDNPDNCLLCSHGCKFYSEMLTVEKEIQQILSKRSIEDILTGG